MEKKKLPMEKTLLFHLLVVIFLYVVLGFAATLVLQYIFSLFHNPLTEYLYLRADAIYILYLVIGLTCIFYHYWKKPWSYLGEVVTATQAVYKQDSHPIELSVPLRDVENQMNEIKMSTLLNQYHAQRTWYE